MSTLYYYKTCPFCNQGRLYIWKNLDTHTLYLHCEECEWGYKTLQDLNDKKAFLTLLEDYKDARPTYDDIRDFGWGHLELTTIEE